MVKVFTFVFFFVAHAWGIENYAAFKGLTLKEGTLYVITRSFTKEAKPYYLLVNTTTLKTHIETLPQKSIFSFDKRFDSTLFSRLLYKSTALHVSGGATHALTSNTNAIFLTMDMCPSQKKGYEDAFLSHLTTRYGKTPIAIALSSAWVLHHEDAFKALQNNPLLDITWVNHSHTHFYDKTLKDNENFMLYHSSDIKNEILGLEQLLIERGITPTVFFRFPGLMANKELMKELRETYFLIPLGADAWIAKEERIKNGSFILIHGNKNEPKGIEMLEEMFETLPPFFFAPILKAFVP